MKTLFLTLTLLFVLPTDSLKEVRSSFQDASKNKSNAESFYELVNSIEKESAVHIAYAGGAETILSKYLDSNIEKLKYFRQGVEKIEKAIDENPNNTEVRFVRLVIQLNSPDFLNYNENIDADKVFVLNHFSECSVSVQKMIRDYVSKSDYFSEEEKSQLK